MKVRAAVLVLSLVSVGLAAPAAVAATKPKPKPLPRVCNIVTDPTGDAAYNNVPGDGSDDLVSGDLASNGKVITAVVRTAALAVPDTEWLPGHAYFFYFAVKGADNQLFLSARTYPQGTAYFYGYEATDPTSGINTNYALGSATGSVDTTKKEVHITAPLSGFTAAGAHLKLGTKLISPTLNSDRIAGQGFVPSQNVGPQRVPFGGLLLPFDDASGSKPYVIGQRSCVTPGS